MHISTTTESRDEFILINCILLFVFAGNCRRDSQANCFAFEIQALKHVFERRFALSVICVETSLSHLLCALRKIENYYETNMNE